jgi:hypothetical protein
VNAGALPAPRIQKKTPSPVVFGLGSRGFGRHYLAGASRDSSAHRSNLSQLGLGVPVWNKSLP